jgi:hypothetical protein
LLWHGRAVCKGYSTFAFGEPALRMRLDRFCGKVQELCGLPETSKYRISSLSEEVTGPIPICQFIIVVTLLLLSTASVV